MDLTAAGDASTAAPRDERMQDSPLRHEPHAWLLQALAESHSTNGPPKLAMCVLYAFGPEDIKASSPGNVAMREELAKDGSSVESVEVTIIIMRGMCMCWGVAEIALSLIGVTLLLKVCRYFIPVEY